MDAIAQLLPPAQGVLPYYMLVVSASQTLCCGTPGILF